MFRTLLVPLDGYPGRIVHCHQLGARISGKPAAERADQRHRAREAPGRAEGIRAIGIFAAAGTSKHGSRGGSAASGDGEYRTDHDGSGSAGSACKPADAFPEPMIGRCRGSNHNADMVELVDTLL